VVAYYENQLNSQLLCAGNHVLMNMERTAKKLYFQRKRLRKA
jgi:hypothetical protein